MSQHDLVVDNASGASVRSDINSALQALGSTSKGNSAPSTIYAGQLWIDDNTPSSSIWTLFVYDGSDSIAIGAIDTSNNWCIPTLGAGSAGLPSCIFTGDTNTGMWSPAADTIAWSTGGTEAMRISSGQNVGIGGAPGSTGATGRLEVHTGSGAATRFLMSQATVTNYSLQIPASTDRLDFVYGASTIRVSLDSSGNVGIGTTNPNGYRLAIDGGATSASIGFGYSGTQKGWIGYSSQFGTATAGTDMTFRNDAASGRFCFGFAGTEHFRVTSTGLQLNGGYGQMSGAYVARAWVNFDGTGTPAIRAAGNVSSITDNGVGDYTLNFTNNMPDANYALVGTGGIAQLATVANKYASTSPTVSAARIGVYDDAGTPKDEAYISVAVIR